MHICGFLSGKNRSLMLSVSVFTILTLAPSFSQQNPKSYFTKMISKKVLWSLIKWKAFSILWFLWLTGYESIYNKIIVFLHVIFFLNVEICCLHCTLYSKASRIKQVYIQCLISIIPTHYRIKLVLSTFKKGLKINKW